MNLGTLHCQLQYLHEISIVYQFKLKFSIKSGVFAKLKTHLSLLKYFETKMFSFTMNSGHSKRFILMLTL